MTGGAADAASRLGITDTRSVVLAVGGLDEDEAGPAASLEAGRQRMADTLAVHLSAVHPRAAAALVGGVAYGIRYRLRRIADLADLDLDDPDARFAAMLQLRLLGSATELPGLAFRS